MNEDLEKKRICFTAVATTRGTLLECAIRLESILDFIIAQHFIVPDLHHSFIKNFLQSENCTTSFKLKILNKAGILGKLYKGIKKDLQRLFEIRNIVAHAKLKDIEKFAVMHKEKEINLAKLQKEFSGPYIKICGVLMDFIEKQTKKEETEKK